MSEWDSEFGWEVEFRHEDRRAQRAKLLTPPQPAQEPVKFTSAAYAFAIETDGNYSCMTVGHCTAEQYGQAMAALHGTPPAAQPAQRPWVGLTESVRQQIVQRFCLNVGDWTQNGKSVAIAVEAELKEKNT